MHFMSSKNPFSSKTPVPLFGNFYIDYTGSLFRVKQHHKSYDYYCCSKVKAGWKARFKISKTDGEISVTESRHCHKRDLEAKVYGERRRKRRREELIKELDEWAKKTAEMPIIKFIWGFAVNLND